MSDRQKYPDSDTESENDSISQENKNENNLDCLSINEVLKKALEEAANPGIGDEEPENLMESEQTSDSKRSNSIKDSSIENKIPKYEAQFDPESQNGEENLNRILQNTDLSNIPTFDNMRERAKYIPIRLSYDERKTLRLVSSCIKVSDYTSTIDQTDKPLSKSRRKHTQLQHIVAFLTGLLAATHYQSGQELLENRNFSKFETQIKEMLEIARRYKITNPEKMRTEYGKLIYLMQDAVSENIQPLLGINIHQPITTVYDLLYSNGGEKALEILDEKLIFVATEEILPDKNKSRNTIQNEIKKKERSIEYLVKKYSSHKLKPDTIRHCLYSITDNNSFLNSNKKPVEECIHLLKKYFSPQINQHESEYSLSIQEGISGSRLSHSHENQYRYVLQSLTLWANILEDMFRLWYLAEQDLLEKAEPYDLKNTGQGFQRVQQSPRVYKAMHEILISTQKQVGSWVGTSVIHLGDHNVPNALIFIDKYTQVARILGPLVLTLKNLESACEQNEGINRYLNAYGGIEKAKKDILHDFFTHAFDGSGGDNFFDAGSCIDGRLTSAWNWCSKLQEKDFYPLFKLTGFLSFDGQFES